MFKMVLHSEEPVAGNSHGGFCGGRKGVICASTRHFLSYKAIHQPRLVLLPKQQPNFLILNSLGFWNKMKVMFEKYPSIHLFLDRDKRGLEISKEALLISRKYLDKSLIYKNHKDLNEYLMKEHLELKQSQRKSRRL
jgi:hypothetical protein